MSEETRSDRGRALLSLVLGAAALSVVVAVAVAWGDRADFEAQLAAAEPAWLAVGVALQAATYATPAGAWRLVLGRAGAAVRFRSLYGLALVQLFTNQALPIGGLAGLVVVLEGLKARGVARPIALAAMLVDQLGFLLSFNLSVVLALGWYAHRDLLPPALVGIGAVGVTIGLGLIALFLRLARGARELPPWLARNRQASELAADVLAADPALVRSPSLVAAATALRLGNVALDAATSWACLRAVGVDLAPIDAAAAFMVASLGRSLGVVPGGLGTYEAASMGGLVALGVPIEAALTSTLLTRLLTFWLPMIPGLALGGRLGLRRA